MNKVKPFFNNGKIIIDFSIIQHCDMTIKGALAIITKHTRWDHENNNYANLLWIRDSETIQDFKDEYELYLLNKTQE